MAALPVKARLFSQPAHKRRTWTHERGGAGSRRGRSPARHARGLAAGPTGWCLHRGGTGDGDGPQAARGTARAWCDTRMTAEAGSGSGPVVIDGGDRSCVQLLLELRGRIARHQPGTVIHLIAADPAAPLDLAAWCHMTGHRYLGAAGESPDCRPVYALLVSGSPRPTDAVSPWRPA